jgi:hypothetical protein
MMIYDSTKVTPCDRMQVVHLGDDDEVMMSIGKCRRRRHAAWRVHPPVELSEASCREDGYGIMARVGRAWPSLE